MALDIDNSRGELVIDPYKHKERYKNWDKTIAGISASNEAIIVRYLEDMRKGININPKARKGKRGYHRLNNQKHRLKRITVLLEKHYNIKNLAVKTPKEAEKMEDKIRELFEKIEEGDIRRTDGKRYTAVRDYIKGFKAFWHWYMVYMKRENNILLPDIAEYIAVKEDRKPQFVYFGEVGSVTVEEGFKKLLNHAKPQYKPLMAFLFDSGIRCPTELMNVKRKDITPIKDSPYFWLNIRDETSKTYGRRIKLMLCHHLLTEYLEDKNFTPGDFIFPINPRVVNQYFSRLGERVLGKKDITMYSFRHNSACYYLLRYKSENGFMYKFGWKDSKMIHYYTELLGMKDTIQEEDFLIDVTKAELEKQVERETKERLRLSDELDSVRQQLKKINSFMNGITSDNPDILDLLAERAKKQKLSPRVFA